MRELSFLPQYVICNFSLPRRQLEQFHSRSYVHLLLTGSIWTVHAEIPVVEETHDEASIGIFFFKAVICHQKLIQ